MIGNSFTMTRQPYEPNYRGLVDAVIDLKEGFPTFAPLQVGFDATAFEDVSENDALFMRTSDGKVGKASAANGLLRKCSSSWICKCSCRFCNGKSCCYWSKNFIRIRCR